MRKGTTSDHNSQAKATNLDYYGDLLTVEDLSKFFGVSKQTVYKEIRDGKFGEPLRLGRSYRIPKIYISQRYLVGFNGEITSK